MGEAKFWVGLIAILLVVVAVGGGYYFLNRPQGAEILLEFGNPGEILVGQPFELPVSFANYSDRILEEVRVSIFLPPGMVLAGRPKEQRVLEKLIGDLGPGSLGQENFSLIVLDGAQTLKRVEAKLNYRLRGSEAVFESSAAADIAISKPAVDLFFKLPDKVFSGEDFEIALTYQNNGRNDLKNLRLRVDYPPVFQYKNSSLPPAEGKNVWNIPQLRRGEEEILVVSGNAVGPPNTLFSFGAQIEAEIQGQRYVLANQSANLSLTSSPLQLEVTLVGGANYVASVGDSLRYLFRYRNNSAVAMNNVSIRAVFSGDMFDFATARSDGAFNSLTNTFSWSGANVPALLSLPPGSEGEVWVDLSLKKSFPIRRWGDKNFLLKVGAEIESPTVPPGVVAERTVSVARLETKVRGELEVDAQAYFRDAPSGVLNSGPYPPKANQPTQYTVHWLVKNYANDVSDAKVSAFLQSGSRFTGVVKSNIPSVPVYNAASGEVSWYIGNIQANKGVVDAPLEAIFQIENTPAVNQVGQAVTLIGETKITAKDTFTDLILESTDFSLTTNLPDDKTITQYGRAVQP